MATTIVAATLTTTISESITINGQSMGSSNNLVITDIAEVFKRIVTIPTGTEVILYSTHDTDVAGSTFDDDLIKYVRITNKDGDNFIVIRIQDANGDEFVYKLDKYESFILCSHTVSMNAESSGIAGTIDANIVSVKAKANTAECDCEIFIASI